MGRLTMEDMLMEMAEKLYSDDDCADTEQTKALISRAQGLIGIADTMTQMTETKLKVVKFQLENGVEFDPTAKPGYKIVETKRGVLPS